MPAIYSCDDADDDISDIFIVDGSAEIAGMVSINNAKRHVLIFMKYLLISFGYQIIIVESEKKAPVRGRNRNVNKILLRKIMLMRG